MVDKAVDVGWKREVSSKRLPSFKDASKPPASISAQILSLLMMFIKTLFTLLQSVASSTIKNLPSKTQPHLQNQDFSFDSASKEEFQPPSPAPSFSEADFLSFVLKGLGELEEKVDKLQAKLSVMPSEKEELLNAAVRRVDALEAELISTKKVNHL